MDASKRVRTFYLVRDLASARYWESRELASPDVKIAFERVVFQFPYALVDKDIFAKMADGVTLAHKHASSNPQGVLPIAKCIMMNTMDTGITLTNSKIKSSLDGWTDLHNYRKSFKPGGKDDKHSDSDFVFQGEDFTAHKHRRRLVLSAECQIGKTGTYISLFQQLRAEIGEGASLAIDSSEEIDLPVAILEPVETLTGLPHAVRWVYPYWEDLHNMLMKRSNFPYFKIRVAKYHPRLVRFRLKMLLTVLKQAEKDTQGGSPLARLGDFWCKFVQGYVATLRHGECIVSAGSQKCLQEWSEDLTAIDAARKKELFSWVKHEVSFQNEQWVDEDGHPPPSIPEALLPFLLRALDWDGRMKQCFREQGALQQDPLADVNGDPKSWDEVFGAAGGRAEAEPGNALVRRDPVLDGCAEEPLSNKQTLEDSAARKNAAAQGYFPSVFTSVAPSGGGQEYTLGNVDRKNVLLFEDGTMSAAVKFWIPEEFEHTNWVQREGGTITGFKEKQRGDQKRFRWIFNPTAFRADKAMLDYSRSCLSAAPGAPSPTKLCTFNTVGFSTQSGT